MTTRCPCCGVVSEFDRPLVDLNSNTVSFRGKEVRVRPKLAEFISVLAAHYPQPVRRSAVIAKLWGAAEIETADNGVRLLAYQAREATKGWPVSVTANSRGYQLGVVLNGVR